MSDVLFIDDDAAIRDASVQSLELAGLTVTACDSAQAAFPHITPDFPGVIVTDVRMPVVDGLELFRGARRIDAGLPVILISGHGDIPMAVEAMRNGAYDFLAKPFPAGQLVTSVKRALETRRLVLENRGLKARLKAQGDGDVVLIGETPAMQRLKARLSDIADAAVDVLVYGETGTGKEVVARALHQWSSRAAKPFVALNCGALPDSVVESELFGHEAGAFTGAHKKRVGRIAHAHGGTLFLDEIESMSPSVQVRLLRVLQERVVEPLGTNAVEPVDLRVVAASKIDLAEEVKAGRFRQDLLYRLAVVTVRLPPLRERRSDIPLLFEHFLARAGQRLRREPPPLSQALRQRLAEHDWPGNVRELAHLADRVILGLDEEDAPAPASSPAALGLAEQVEAFEKDVLRGALERHRGDVRAITEQLGLARKTFYDKVNRHGLDPASYRRG